jgi:ABC-type transport system involved in multi-copper enzyme maturation permease subunit
MNDLLLLSAMLELSEKLVSWLTPLWLLGVGVVLGLLSFLVIWAVAAVISRLGPIGRIGADRGRTMRWSTIVTLVLGSIGITLLAIKQWDNLVGGDDGSTLAAIGRLLSLALPALIALWLGVFGFLMLVWRRTVQEMPQAIIEGVLWPILVASIFLVGFGFMGFFATEAPVDILKTLGRLNAVGTSVHEFSLEASPEVEEANVPLQARPVPFRYSEIVSLSVYTDQRITVTRDSASSESFGQSVEVLPEEDFEIPLVALLVGAENDDVIEQLHFGNPSATETEVTVTVRTAVVYPQVWIIPWTAGCLVFLFLLYIVQRVAFPRLSAVALSTYKSEVAQPLFSMLLGVGALALILFIWIPYNTFGEDIKMLKDTGLTLIMVLSILLALWAASTSVSEEIEGRTALTVLSKPLTRRSFVLGKFVGITWTVALMFIVLGVVFILVVAYKPIFDAKENTTATPSWQLCFQEMMHVVPGLLLAFMETVVLAALSVAISTRLPLLANFTICLSIYALGHLTPMIVQSSMGSFPIVGFFGQLIATVFPNLDHFNMQAAVAAGVGVPSAYLGWAFIYCLIYTVIAVLLALVMFEDRDLA